MKTNVTPGHAGRKIFKLILFLFVATLLAPIQNVWAQTNYYVGGTGASDSNPGTSSQPFATIQKAATVAVSGNIVNIRPGTYRETVTPVNSGVTFQPDGSGAVIISGLNTADGGWTVHSGNIYKKTITLPVDGYSTNVSGNTNIGANQVFKDTTMQIEARWPKAGHVTELLDRNKLRQRNSTSNWSSTSITDSGIPNIAGGWTGGKIWITGWFIAQTKDITSHSGTTIGFPSTGGDLRFAQYYYITGRLGALTQAKEWHYENNTLYFWQNGGGSPTGVQYKARNWGFDLRGKTNTTIIGLQFFACEIMGDINSNNTIIDGIKAKYLNHTFLLTGGGDLYTNARQTGIRLLGPNSILRNSEIQYAASQGVWLGANCRLENNLITDINYEGNYGAGVNFWIPTGGQVVTRNTLKRMGRSAIDLSEFEGLYPLGTQKHFNMDISYNDISSSLMLSSDGGQLYGSVYTDLTGTRIHHNWIYDSKAVRTPSAGYTVGISAGMYLDQASGPITFDHNVLWNNYECDFHTWQNAPKRNAGKSWIYNNTFVTDGGDDFYSERTYLTVVTDYFDVMRNNISRDDVVVNWYEIGNGTWASPDHIPKPGGDAQTCLFEETNPVFVGTGAGGLAYRIQTTSPAKNTGTVISGITDGSVGVPDMGAYEFGGIDWVPGYVVPAGGMVATPTFSPGAGTYTTAQSVTLSTSTSGSSIRYTTDGSTPTASSTLYSTPISISATTTLKAIGIKSGMTNSDIATAVYTINISGTTTVNNTVTGTGQNQFEYVGAGWASGPSTGAYQNDEHYNLTTNSYYQVDFTGTQIQVYSQKFSSSGISAYSIDGGAETLVDQYNPTLLLNTLVYTSPTLSSGSHTLKARITGTKNASSSSYWLVADRVVITAGETTVATPTFNPVAGTYTNAQSVTISTTTPGAEIRYTTNGTTPTGSSTLYTGPVSVSATTTLKAIGIKSGLTNSAVATSLYTIQVATPTFNPIEGTYATAQSVTISTATSGAEIRYTTNGTTPTGSSTLYTGPVSVSTTTTLKAIGIKSDLANSDVATAVYTIQSAFNDMVTGTGQNQFEYVGAGWGSGPSVGAYLNDEHYSAATNDYYQFDFTGTQIQVYSQKFNSSGIAAYSIDGGAETNVDHYNSTLLLNTLVWTSPTLTQGAHTLKVRVTGTKNASSSSYWLVADRVVVIANTTTVATPTFSPVAGTYTSTQSVAITTSTSGSTMRYTTDGSTPTGSSTLYSAPVSVSASTTLKAIGIKAGLANSDVGTAAYTIQVATPTFSPVAGTYTSTQSVTISTATSGSTIRYTTDGSTPTASSTLYSSPVSVSSSMTLKAIGIKSGLANSAVGSAAYTIQTTTTINNTVTGTGQNQFEYVGTGWLSGPSTGAYQNDEHYNLTTNSYYNVDFTGAKIEVYSQKFNSSGISAYSIDGGPETLVDQYNPTLLLNTLVYSSPNLTPGPHTLKARVTGTKNASSSSYWLVADRVVILSSASGRMRTSAAIDQSQDSEESLVIYPNPGTGRFSLKGGYNIQAIEVYNAMGAKVQTLKNTGHGIQEIDISTLPDGIYFITLFNGEGYISRKVIKAIKN